jgi:cytochrome P450
MAAFFRDRISPRRAAPRDDLISAMIAARDDDGRLSEDELVATCMLILFGGHETATSLLTTAVDALPDHPDPLARLRVERFPNLARGSGEPLWLDAMVMRGLTRLPLRLR